ncbi:MAG: hypothetical protein ACK5N0_10990 [Synechococcaceae cyanobacterium]
MVTLKGFQLQLIYEPVDLQRINAWHQATSVGFDDERLDLFG